MAPQVVVSRSEAVLAQIVVDLADSLHEEIDPGYKVIARAGTVTTFSTIQTTTSASSSGQ